MVALSLQERVAVGERQAPFADGRGPAGYACSTMR